MTDELEWFFKITVGSLMGLGAWTWRNVVGDIKELKRDSDKNGRDLLQLKFEVERDYAKETSVQMSLDRLHGRLDDVADDIKKLLQRH